MNLRATRLLAISPLARCSHPAFPPMSATPTPREMVDRLDARHEELIQKLDDLNARIEATLAEFARARVDKAANEDVVRKAA